MSQPNSSSPNDVFPSPDGGTPTDPGSKRVDVNGSTLQPALAVADGDSSPAALSDELRFERMLSQLTGPRHNGRGLTAPSLGPAQDQG